MWLNMCKVEIKKHTMPIFAYCSCFHQDTTEVYFASGVHGRGIVLFWFDLF